MSHFKLAILASGNGSNAEAICQFFADHPFISVCWIGSNKPDAFVLQRAERLGIPFGTFTFQELQSDHFSHDILQKGVTHIILAGFLLKIPNHLLVHFPDRVINIHPALLPAFGGKGMYGSHVHEAVIKSGADSSGITIHLVNEHYDEGKILFQTSCPISPEETAESLAKKIHLLEHVHFPVVIEDYILGAGHNPDK